MKITVLCSNRSHPIMAYIEDWTKKNRQDHSILIVHSRQELISDGDILFLISCNEIIDAKVRSLYKNTFVLHASNLPVGRGWSPHIWQIINDSEEITVSLIEADDLVDSGKIWLQKKIYLSRDLLWDEINQRLFEVEIELIDLLVHNFSRIIPANQNENICPTYYPRRTPSDSRLDPGLSLIDQFNKIRVCDPNRYPAYFDLHGHRYKLILEKIKDCN